MFLVESAIFSDLWVWVRIFTTEKRVADETMISEQFAIGNSVIHRIDPRLKIAFASIFSVVVAVSGTFYTLFTALFVSLGLVWLARLDFRAVAHRLTVVLGFTLLIWLVLPITLEGEPMAILGPLKLSREGILLSARITIKVPAILLALMALVTTMTIATLGHSLGRMKAPQKLTHLLLITYRYVFVIEQEFHRLRRAAKIRGFTPDTSARTYKTYAWLVGMLFVCASARGKRVHQAMLCRGFKGRFYSLHLFERHGRNRLFIILMSMITVILLLLEGMG
jgi:cobalt/nickel transport system permease protein